ncbi:MAG: hypothetical protein DHS80DRAFT_21935 [Piptocephalis tieghemiana]|nr:MAG: hypothetical protein DHS80DRAFT_21935 [Piptocephalis tieghemiana]
MQSYFSLRRLSALWSDPLVSPSAKETSSSLPSSSPSGNTPRSASFSFSSSSSSSSLSDPTLSSSSTFSSSSSLSSASSTPSSPYHIDYASLPSHTPGGFVRAVRALAQESAKDHDLPYPRGTGVRRASHAGECRLPPSPSPSSGNPYAPSPTTSSFSSGRKPSLPTSIYGGGTRESSGPIQVHSGALPSSSSSSFSSRTTPSSPLSSSPPSSSLSITQDQGEDLVKQRAIFLSIRVMRILPNIVPRDFEALPLSHPPNHHRSTLARLIASRLYTLWSLSHPLPQPHLPHQERALALRDARIARAGAVITQLDCGLEADYAVHYALDQVFHNTIPTSKKVSMVEMAREALAKAIASEATLSPGEKKCMYRFHQLVGAPNCHPLSIEEVDILLGLEEEEEKEEEKE